MYYLIKPDLTVLWADVSEFFVERFERDNPGHPINYSRFGWQPAERRFDAGTLNVALRFGIAAEGGIVVGAQALVPLDYYRNMEAAVNRELRRDSTNVPHAQLFESLMPGWTEETENLDQRVLDSQQATLERAERELTAQLTDTPINPELAEYWENLGAPLPPQPPPA